MNKWTYPREPLTWGNLEKLIQKMPQDQKEREVLGYGWFNALPANGSTHSPKEKEGYKVVILRKLLVTNDYDNEICDSGQPILLF